MEDLQIVGTEDGALVLEAPDGARYRLAIDEQLHASVRQPLGDQGTNRRLSPREIQAQIRAGMTAHEVAAMTGASLEYIERFEGPVMAEREFVIESALQVPVHTAAADPLAPPVTFGDAILERLRILDGADERWTSWKDSSGWVVRLTYTIGVVEHDARWQFDPKRQTLSPINAEAVGLSQQESTPEPVPHLRAVPVLPADPPVRSVSSEDRFDSGAFAVDPSDFADSGPVLAPVGRSRGDATEGHSHTADLLEALRRRRGQREGTAPEDEANPASGGIRLVEIDIDTEAHVTHRQTGPQPRGKKGRPTLPSWDEIVFGARPEDDDLA